MKASWTFLLILLLVIPSIVFAQAPANETQSNGEEVQPSRGFQFSFKNRPSLQIGNFMSLDLSGKWHFDFQGFDPPRWNPPAMVSSLPTTPPTFYLTRARLGLKGDVTKRAGYEFERDFRETFGSDHEWHPWKDAYVNFKVHSLIEVKVGKFKIPFGMEANLSEDRLDFVFKSRTSDTLAPARERGVMLHAKFLKEDHLEYQVGVFRYDGEGSDIHGQPTASHTYAARLSGEPLRYLKPLPKTVRHLYLGVAATHGRMIDGLNGIHGETFSNFTFFDHVFVSGNRTRTGAEMTWSEGPFGIKGEYIHMSEERKQQGIRGEDLPDKISRGWYLTGSWALLGKFKSSGKPKDPFLTGHGYGAVEMSARFDVLTFYSAPGSGLPSRSPRAPAILPNGERTWTFGPTWYLNRFVKIQANAQREALTDIERKAVLGQTKFWTGVIRLQLAM